MNRKRAVAEGANLAPKSTRKRRSSQAELDRLCSRCAGLDIKQLWSSTGTKIALGPIETWAVEACVLCNFLANLLSPTHEDALQARDLQHNATEVHTKQITPNAYHLYSMKTRKASMRLLQILEPRMIVLSNAGHGPPPDGIPYITLQPTEPPFWLKQIQPLIDFNQPKEWLNLCSQLHGQHCMKGQGNITPSLRLIDCSTGEVVRARPDDAYVALSYVWGHDYRSGQNSSGYPQTIQDAITVTRKLGYNHLWVDKYCMDQDDQVEFHNQLQQMDAIYQQAIVTLIAAAGTHAEHGLPGVSTRFRTPSDSVRVGPHYLSAVRDTPDLLSQKYKWTSRAWTFQEGLLSTRRLVFTDDQLYFECQGFYCVEMVDMSLEMWKKIHHRDQPYLHPMYRVAPYMGVFPLDGCGVDPWDIYNRIHEYSGRSLTFPSDILKGMLGIFRAFERSKSSLRHLHGVPFPGMARSSPNKSTWENNSKRTMPTFSESLRWTTQQPSQRRKGFPSWSWTGWYGVITWPLEYTDSSRHGRTPRRIERPRDPTINEDAIRISIELQDGTYIDWEAYQIHYDQLLLSDKLSDTIRLEAHVSPIELVHDGDDTRSSVRLSCTDGQSIVPLVDWTTTLDVTLHSKLLAIQFYRTAPRPQEKGDTMELAPAPTMMLKQHILIVQERETHWERVAYGTYMIDPQMDVDCTWQCLRLG